MSPPRRRIVAAILAKDLRQFSRDRFYVFISILGLVTYIVLFWIIPDRVDETVAFGVHADGLDSLRDALEPGDAPAGAGIGGLGSAASARAGVEIVWFDSTDALRAGVTGEEGATAVGAGIDFPDDFAGALAERRPTTVTVYLDIDLPSELQTAVRSLARELSFAVAGAELPVTQLAHEEVVLGEDRVGDQVSVRERTRPLFVFFVLMIETFALASLVAAEIQSRTVTAVLTTPAGIVDFLVAKGILGTALAFSQALLLMAAIGSLVAGAPILLVAMLLGAAMVTGFGLVAGARGKDFISVVYWSMLFMVPLSIPAVVAMFPGTASAWVRTFPTYPLVETIVGVSVYGQGWGESMSRLGMTLAWVVAIAAAGAFVLKRRVESL